MATGGLTRWFKEQWVDISRPKEGGGFEPCGRKDADEGKYPKCVPASRAAKMTEAEIKSAVSRKRRAESTERREGKKPISVKTKVEKKNVPTDPKLYAEVKAAAKRKFDVYPSAYANGWLVQEYKRRGGRYKTVAKGSVGLVKHLAGSPSDHDQSTHGRGNTADSSTDYRMQHRPSLRGGYGAPAHSLTDLYPEDVYSRKAVQYYGTGAGTTEAFDPDAPELRGGGSVDIDREVWGELIRMRGNPDAEVSIYRAVPLDGYDRIQRGDWVAITPEYAREHGESSLRGNFKIIEATVRAGDIFTSGDSWQEWGWDAEDAGEDWAGRVIAVAEESVSKHLGTQHDQQTHGRRRVAVGGKYPTVVNEKDTEGKYSAEARQLAASVRASRMEHEPQLTDSLMRSLESHGADAYGLKFRVKTEKSIARKIDADSAEKGQFRAEVAEGMSDIIRYTGVVEAGKYSDTIWKVLDDLRADGIEFDRIKNFWPKGDPYDGINIKMKHPAGFKFELQFHTPESIETKNKSHKIYDLYREETDTKKRYTYYNRMVRLWAQVDTPSGALEIGEQISESFVAMTKAAYRTIKRLDDNDNVVAEYRFSDANKTIVEQRKTSDGWVDAHGEVVWYLISGTWGYEPSSESVAKHLGTAHDQTTHGRRKTSTGLSAVREAARNTELSLHRYGEIEGQTSFFTDEPYTKPKQAEYKVGIGTVKDTTPVPKPAGDLSETTEEEDLEIARSVFDMDIELDDGRLVEVRVADVRASYSSMRVVGSVMVDGEVAGRFDRHLDFDSGYAGNSSFAINKNFQGQGLGSTILRHWEDQYHQAGLYEMYVTAQSSPGGYNGAYTWLRYGYQPEDPVSLFTAYVESVVADIDDVDSAVDAADSLRPLFDASMSDATADGLREKILYVGMDEMTLVDVEQDIRDAMYGGYWTDPLAVVAVDDKFANFLKNGDISWNGRKDTEPLFYNQYAKSDGGGKAAREVISRWMIEDPAGLENDDPQFWSDIRAAFKKVKKDNPTVNSVHVASVMGSKKRRKKKRGISGVQDMSKKEPIKDPKGGLTAAGRAHFKRKEGANLKPGVKGKADTPEKMRRKGSFLTRFYTNPSGPLQNDKGEPTRLALAAAAWGEPVPKNRSDAAKLAAKGRRLLERYENVKKHATHDQKTHGRRKTATGGGTKPKMRRITEAASKRAKQLAAMARDGGFTFNPKRSEMRSKGVAVAVGKENERKVRADEFNEESIRQYTRDHAELLAQPRHHLGAWRETEKGVDYIYLDVSVVMPSLESAADLGRANDQIGIFDLSTFTTYYRAPDKEGDLKYIPLNLTDATGYAETAATDMATNVGKADGDKGVMFVPGEMLDESSLPKIVERIMALKPVGKSEKESRKNS